MKITKFDKVNLKQLRADMDAALKAVAAKHGIDLSIGSIRYTHTGDSFTARLTGAVEQQPAKLLPQADGTFKQGASTPFPASHKWTMGFYKAFYKYGLTQTDLGRDFEYGGDTYRLCGITLHGKFPIVAGKVGYDGQLPKKFMLLPASVVTSALAQKVAA